jgi:hypothetical protein
MDLYLYLLVATDDLIISPFGVVIAVLLVM